MLERSESKMPFYEADAITSFKGKFSYLHNWYRSMVPFEEAFYPTAEHAYQAAMFTDPEIRKKIRECGSVVDAKLLASVHPIRNAWELIRFKVMKRIIKAKFATHYKLAVMLSWTEGRELVYGDDPGDKLWGAVQNQYTKEWEGDNRLGKILMEVRDEQFRTAE